MQSATNLITFLTMGLKCKVFLISATLMKNETKKILKWILFISLVYLIYTFAFIFLSRVIPLEDSIGGIDIKTDKEKIESLPAELKLKTDKDKIIYYEALPDGVKGYRYITDKEIKAEVNEKIEKRESNMQIFSRSDGKETARLWGTGVYYKDKDKWFEVSGLATTTKEAYDLQTKETVLEAIISFFTGKKVLADFDSSYATAGDGYVKSESCSNWANCITQTDGDYTYPTNASGYAFYDGGGKLYRAWFVFDASPLGTGITISTSSIFLYAMGGNIFNVAGVSMTFTEGTQASDTTLGTADFDAFNTTHFSDRLLSTLTGNTYEEWELNSAGRDNISLTGKSKFFFGIENDIDSGASPGLSGMGTYFSEDATRKPYLEITYTAGGGGADPCTPTAGQPFFQSQDCYLTTDVYHNDKWIDNGHKLIYKGGRLILE